MTSHAPPFALEVSVRARVLAMTRALLLLLLTLAPVRGEEMRHDTGLTTRWRRRQTSPLLENVAARPAYDRAFREADASLRAKFHALQTPIAADASGGDGAGAGGPRVLLVRWNRWGLFCSWNAIARAVLYAIASERARRDAFFLPRPPSRAPRTAAE